MTWQEELRQLDSALAEGQLAANEYRKRRDEILAAASSAQPPSPVIGPPTGPQPVLTADDGDNGGDNGADNAEVTQVVNVKSDEADETQIIDATTMAGAKNGEAPTQAVTPPTSPAPPVPATPAPQQQPVWSAQPPDPAVPPPGMFPPQQPQPMPGPSVTPMDAQDLFTSNKPPAGSKKPWLITVAVLVVLAVAGGAVWFFGFRDTGGDGNNTAQNQEPTTTSEAPAPPPPVDITGIELPGTPGKNSGEMDIARASELSVIAPAEGALIADTGVDKLVHTGSLDGDLSYLLYAYKSEDAAAATELAGKLVAIQKQLGYEETDVDGVPAPVTVTSVVNDKAAAMRGVYTYGDTTIQLSVLQKPAGDGDELRTRFRDAMTTVTDAAPPQE